MLGRAELAFVVMDIAYVQYRVILYADVYRLFTEYIRTANHPLVETKIQRTRAR